MVFLLLCEWVFCFVKHTLRLIEADILYSEITEYIVDSLSVVSECNSTVMREVSLNKNVTVETSHFLDSENTYAAE